MVLPITDPRSREIVQSRLEPLHDRMELASREAIQAHLAIRESWAVQGVPPDRRTLSTELNNLMRRCWAAKFEEEDRVIFIQKSGFEIPLIDDEFMLPLKKMNRRGLTSNHRSEQQDRLREQQLVLGFPEAAYLTFGFRVDDTYSELLELRVLCPDGYDRNHWSYVVFGEEGQSGILPLAPEGPVAAPKIGAPRIRRKEGTTDR